MLRLTRIIFAAIFFISITLLFLDFTGTLHRWLGWMADIQFLPAVLAANTLVVAGLILLTVLFGRIYCSVICPLGIMQDIISWSRGKLNKKDRFRFRYTKENKWLRYGFLTIFIVAMALGANYIALLIAPYSVYGRIASNLFAPVYQWVNNFFAWIAERYDSYAFYSIDVWIKSIPTFIIAAGTFLIISFLAWKRGRTYCNTICPIGTILGFFSRRSIFVPVIDTEKCRNCGLCGRQCKASCIDMENHKIDYSRCVTCMDCLETCNEGAISYQSRYQSSRKHNTDSGRRAFFISSILLGSSIASEAHKKQKGSIVPVVSVPEKHNRETPIVPAGSISLKNFTDRCTACQLCISMCPEKVLQPSSSLWNLMQPEMSFNKGYCRPECNKCSEICPTGAIKPVSIEEKSSIQVGHAVVNLDLCVVITDDVNCGNCARHCPAGAIKMVWKNPYDADSRKIPAIDEFRCIGCGACEHLCPSRPLSAIHIEGHEVHKMN